MVRGCQRRSGRCLASTHIVWKPFAELTRRMFRRPLPRIPNHLERALRVVPGRKSWLFCWIELGAKRVGIIQSLIVTCRLSYWHVAHLRPRTRRTGRSPIRRIDERRVSAPRRS
jgi:hypothetical protein